MVKSASLALLALLSVPAAAQTAAGPPPPQRPAADAKKNPLDRVVCKTEDTLGSRLGAHRVCATVREWQDQALDNRQAVEKMQGPSTIPSN